MMAATSTSRREIHHRVPRCLLKAYDRGHGPGLDPEDLQAWFDWGEEAFRYRVNPDISREELSDLIESSTVEFEGEEHRTSHSVAGDFVRWGRLGGLATLRRYGRPWFSLLGRRRWGRVSAEMLSSYRAKILMKDGAA